MKFIQAKEAEIEEAENFIPCCFRVMRDKNGKTLKVNKIFMYKGCLKRIIRNLLYLLNT